MESGSESLSGDVELSEGEFAAYGGNAEEQDTSDSGSRGHGAETLNPGQLEECREREVRLVCLVRCDLGAAQVRELLIGARWDVRRLLRAGGDAELDGGAGGGTPEADSCPVCLMSLSGEAEPGEEPPVFFTGCSNGARHGAHAQCMAVYVRSCIKDAATQRGARPGVCVCPVCTALSLAEPGVLTETQVAALVTTEELELYRKVRSPALRRTRAALLARRASSHSPLHSSAPSSFPATSATALRRAAPWCSPSPPPACAR